MRVILQQEVSTLGIEGDVVNVARGYANNYLVPQGMAIVATSGSLKQLDAKKVVLDKKKAEAKTEAEKLATKLVEKQISIVAKVGGEGKLFGSVGVKDVTEAVSEQLGVELDRKSILLKEVIKETGTFNVDIRLHSEVIVGLAVEVKAGEA